MLLLGRPVLAKHYMGQTQVPQLLGQLHVLRVIHRAIDDYDRVVGDSLLQGGDQLIDRLHPVTLGTEALLELDEVGIAERDVAGSAEVT